MRILSDFHDFYDFVMQYGFDPKRIYQRKERVVEEMEQWGGRIHNTRRLLDCRPLTNKVKVFNGLDIDGYVIGFCGKLYPFVRFILNRDPQGLGDNIVYCYNIEKLDESITLRHEKYRDNFNRDHYSQYFDKPKYKYKENIREQTVKWFQFIKDKEPRLDYLFTKYNCPIFLIQPNHCYTKNFTWFYPITLNPRLAIYDFFRIKDAHSTYGEIEQFVGNQLAQEKPIPEMSNNVKIEAAGFDLKTSFRKEKRQR
jgi:hypothetical protein